MTQIPPAFSRVVLQFEPGKGNYYWTADTTDFSRVEFQLRPLSMAEGEVEVETPRG